MTKSKKLIDRDLNNVGSAIYRYTEVAFDRGEGCYLYDVDGKKYIDFAAGIATNNVGHCHPEVVDAIKAQAEKLIHPASHIGYYEAYVSYVEKLKELMPPGLKDGKAILLNSGSEAIEAALKCARMVSGRSAVIAFMGSFHGRPLGAVSVTASTGAYRKNLHGHLGGVYFAPYPYCYRCPLGYSGREECNDACFNFIDQIMTRLVDAQDLAAILVEPIQGEGGYIVPPEGFLNKLREVCDKTGAYLIFDEIQTGFGRTGKMFALEHSGVEPDIITMAKAMGGGLPLGGIIGRKEIMESWGPGSHGTTFGGNPVACAAGLKSIEIIERDGLVENAVKVGEFIKQEFAEAQKDLPQIGDIRGKGLMIGVEINKSNGEPAAEYIKEIVKEAGRNGVVLTKCGANVIRICPALNMDKDTAEKGIGIIIEAVKKVVKG